MPIVKRSLFQEPVQQAAYTLNAKRTSQRRWSQKKLGLAYSVGVLLYGRERGLSKEQILLKREKQLAKHSVWIAKNMSVKIPQRGRIL